MEDDRVVVGEGDAAAAEILGGAGDDLGRGGVGQGVDLAGFGNIVVLAELTGQIAARRAERQHRGSGQEVIERLLLDGIDAETAGAAIGGQNDGVVLTRPNEAQPALALVELTGARADVALDAPVIEGMPVFCLRIFAFRHGDLV